MVICNYRKEIVAIAVMENSPQQVRSMENSFLIPKGQKYPIDSQISKIRILIIMFKNKRKIFNLDFQIVL